MKKINWLLPLAFIIFAGATQAWAPCGLSGYVFCDVNQNGVIDEGDTPYEGVGILIDGLPTTIFTDADGFYYVLDHYVCQARTFSLDLATLPADAIFISPSENEVAYGGDYYNPVQQDWLIDSATCRSEVGGEGCTPGYWKQTQHFDSWGYAQGTMFSSFFADAFPGMTLLDVLRQGGGGINALGRHAVAALLNVTSADVSYDLVTVEQVVNMFNDAYMSYEGEDIEPVKDIFEYFNELGCPLD